MVGPPNNPDAKLSVVLRIRQATASDSTFLQEMLAIAADWQSDAAVRTIEELLREPGLAHYISAWPAEGDFGVVAEADRRLGAAWWRFFSSSDPGYGFINESTPEISIGVVKEARGQGIGSLLLEALIDEARDRDLHALSLSVEGTNRAAWLYRRLGFVTVSRVGGSETMVLNLSR